MNLGAPCRSLADAATRGTYELAGNAATLSDRKYSYSHGPPVAGIVNGVVLDEALKLEVLGTVTGACEEHVPSAIFSTSASS